MNSQNLRILVIDDDEDDYLITSEYIKQIPSGKFTIDWCHAYDEAIAHICDRKYDLYFTDYRLGAKTGTDLLKQIQALKCQEPIILLTGKGNRDVDLEAMQLGAVDYLVKTDLSPEKLERSIRYAMERVAAMRALRANEKKYRGIFENTQDMVFVCDNNLVFKDVNDASLELLGYTKDELPGLILTSLIEKNEQREFLVNTLVSQKEIKGWEVIFATKEGDTKICTLSATLEDDDAESVHVQGIIHDITSLRKEEKVLVQTEKLAAAGRLVRTLAHEVRNPLNNILLSTEQLTADHIPATDENALLYLDIIQRNCRRISDLISELLNTSRPSDMVLKETGFQHLMDEVVNKAIDRITLKRISLNLSYPPEPVTIMADAEKLSIAILNIIINATEAMDEQNGVLTISLHRLTNHAVLNINDNGCGISEEHISRLFEPYFTQKRNGVGLGLAFTMNIIQSHKAALDVTSEPGKGTTFTVSFPLANVEEVPIEEVQIGGRQKQIL